MNKEKFELQEYKDNIEDEIDIPIKRKSSFNTKFTLIFVGIFTIIIIALLFIPSYINKKNQEKIISQFENTDIKDDELGEIMEEPEENILTASGNLTGNTALNLQQKQTVEGYNYYGLVASTKNEIYLSDINNSKLIIIDKNTNEKITELNYNISGLNTIDDNVYGSITTMSYTILSNLIRIQKDGNLKVYQNSQSGILCSIYSTIYCDNNDIYFANYDSEYLYKYDINTNTLKDIAITDSSFFKYPLIIDIKDDMIYYTTDSGLYYTPIDSNSSYLISENITTECEYVSLYKDSIIYTINGKLYIDGYIIDTDSIVTSLNIIDDILYFASGKDLYIISLDDEFLDENGNVQIKKYGTNDFAIEEIYNIDNEKILLKKASQYVIINKVQ